MNRRYSPRSLQGRGGAHSVLLRMAENEERAARIADLKERQPLLTWKKIADKVGVSERSTHAWRKTGAISPENAAVLADILDVDFDYLWFGPKPGTPEMFVDRRNTPKSPVVVDRLDGPLEDRISSIEDTLADITTLLREARSEQDRISELLARQSQVLEHIEAATRDAGDMADRLDEAVEQAATSLRSSAPARPAAPPKTSPKRTPRAAR
jgi:DNA-binding transcriptional MerR regulator